jgi:hypothetical protein
MTQDNAGAGDSAQATMDRRGGVIENIQARGEFRCECWRDGKLVWVEEVENKIVDEGLTAMLEQSLGNGTQSTWYLGLADAAPMNVAAGDTMASHSTWVDTDVYSDTNRLAWSPDAAASKSITNSTSVDYSINATGTIGGLFCCDDNTVGGTSGTLLGAAEFSGGDRGVLSGDTLKLTYTVTLAATT